MLLRGSKPVPLTRKRYEILLLLVENAGQVMAKEEIIERIWPDQFVEEANLANNIHALRRLIESPSAH
jgi:DNA-binding winged helix-turn-helix (wHTH) protein